MAAFFRYLLHYIISILRTHQAPFMLLMPVVNRIVRPYHNQRFNVPSYIEVWALWLNPILAVLMGYMLAPLPPFSASITIGFACKTFLFGRKLIHLQNNKIAQCSANYFTHLQSWSWCLSKQQRTSNARLSQSSLTSFTSPNAY